MSGNPIHTDRRLNTRSRIYKTLYTSDRPMSKLELAQHLSLSMPTVYQNVAELADMGLIRYSGLRPSSGGRPAMNLEIVAQAKYAIGVTIQSESISFAVIDLKCQELAFKEVSISDGLFSDNYVNFFAAELEKFIDESMTDRSRILGVTILIPGILCEDGITIYNSPGLRLKNVSLKPLVEAVPYPVHLDNDANSAGFAENVLIGSSDALAYLYLADGVGGTFFTNGVQHRGSNSHSGEFGHMTVEFNGRKCACGKRGCLEAYCSEHRILSDSGVGLEKFFSLLEEGDEKALSIWENYLRYLAAGIHNIRMAFDSKIVLGGTMAFYLPPYLEKLRQYVYDADPFCSETDYLSISRIPLHATILGGAMYFIKGFLDEN